jgi:hypothetical protein
MRKALAQCLALLAECEPLAEFLRAAGAMPQELDDRLAHLAASVRGALDYDQAYRESQGA